MSVANTSSQLPTSQPADPGFGNRMLAALQSLGRSLMLPVAVLPVAALLLRLGQPDLWQAILHNPGATGAPFIADAGGAVFNNLPMIFAVGIAFGLAGGEGAAALAGLVGFLIFNAVFNDFSPIGKGAHNNNMDVLSGILMGLVASGLYRRFYTIRLPDYLGFFGGRRFVPIITGLSAVVLGVAFGLIWPPIQNALQAFGTAIIGLGPFGPGIYGFFNRLLIPLGLHHVLNSYIWFQLGTYNTAQGPVHGDLLRYFAGDPNAGLFESGFFPMMMFGLPAACLAMIRQARFPKVAAGILVSAAFASFLTGITEPVEFAFLFVAPGLFVVHAFLTATSLFICALLNIHMAFGFSAGLIDYLINFSAKNTTNPLLILVVGVGYAIVYYFVFSFFIKTFNLGTPGRGESSTGLSADWILPESQRGPAPSKKAKANGSTVDKVDKVNQNDTLATQVIEALAGSENIESVEGCITRLRLFIKDPSLIDEPRLKSLGASGVMKQGKIVQVVMGMQSDDIASRMKHQIKEGVDVPTSD